MKNFFNKKISSAVALAIVIVFGYAAIYLMNIVFQNVKY